MIYTILVWLLAVVVVSIILQARYENEKMRGR